MKRFLLTVLILNLILACTAEPPGKPNPLGWLHSDNGRLIDEAGREVLLRGVNARIEDIFDVKFSDGRVRLEPIPTFTYDDAESMAKVGFNFLRLPINWSGLEPEEGEFDLDYLERVAEVVEHCRNAGIYVLIDFHQDAYSKELGEDGAPYWAILPAPTTLREGPLTDLDEQRGAPEVLEAFESFFENKENLIDRFLPAVELVASRFANDSTVVGYEIMNEPVAFHIADGIPKLYAFYERVAETIRKVDTKHTIWMEPEAARNFLLTADLPDGFPDDNIVYTPHMYPPLSDTENWGVQEWIEGLTQTYDRMMKEKDAWGGALVLGEWGANPRNESSIPYIRASYQIFNERLMGASFWLWKENCQGWWGLHDYNVDDDTWSLNELAAKEVGQPTVHAAPGTLIQHTFDPETLELAAEIAVSRDGWAQIFIPSRWFSNGFRVLVDGKEVSVNDMGHERFELLLTTDNRRLMVQASE